MLSTVFESPSASRRMASASSESMASALSLTRSPRAHRASRLERQRAVSDPSSSGMFVLIEMTAIDQRRPKRSKLSARKVLSSSAVSLRWDRRESRHT